MTIKITYWDRSEQTYTHCSGLHVSSGLRFCSFWSDGKRIDCSDFAMIDVLED